MLTLDDVLSPSCDCLLEVVVVDTDRPADAYDSEFAGVDHAPDGARRNVETLGGVGDRAQLLLGIGGVRFRHYRRSPVLKEKEVRRRPQPTAATRARPDVRAGGRDRKRCSLRRRLLPTNGQGWHFHPASCPIVARRPPGGQGNYFRELPWYFPQMKIQRLRRRRVSASWSCSWSRIFRLRRRLVRSSVSPGRCRIVCASSNRRSRNSTRRA